MHIREGLTFDDVLLVPAYSDLPSRSEVDLSVKLTKGITVEHPIIPANMKTVTGVKMAEVIYENKGLAILHRFMSFDEQLDIVRNFKSKEGALSHVGFSVGVKKEDYLHVDQLVEAGAKILCIDIAHGNSKMCVEMCDYIYNKYPNVLLIAGNVATADAANRLWMAGADIVKVGVGPGSLCTTRIETGNGVPQLTALMDVYNAAQNLRSHRPGEFFGIIADGGIKNAGDIVKALCFSNLVMTGNIFAGSIETPGNTIYVNGLLCKEYVGSSTHKTSHVEGVSAFVPQKGHANDIISKLLEGVRSGCSYQGAKNLEELRDNPQLVKITNAGLKESHPHDVILK